MPGAVERSRTARGGQVEATCTRFEQNASGYATVLQGQVENGAGTITIHTSSFVNNTLQEPQQGEVVKLEPSGDVDIANNWWGGGNPVIANSAIIWQPVASSDPLASSECQTTPPLLPPDVGVTFAIENVSAKTTVFPGTLPPEPYPGNPSPIPYADMVKLNITLTNNTSSSITNWSLELYGVLPKNTTNYTNIEDVGYVGQLDGLYNGARIRWSGLEIAPDASATVSEYLEARHSGPSSASYWPILTKWQPGNSTCHPH